MFNMLVGVVVFSSLLGSPLVAPVDYIQSPTESIMVEPVELVEPVEANLQTGLESFEKFIFFPHKFFNLTDPIQLPGSVLLDLRLPVSRLATCNPTQTKVAVPDTLKAGLSDVLVYRLRITVPLNDGASPPLPCQEVALSQDVNLMKAGAALSGIKAMWVTDGAGKPLTATYPVGDTHLKAGDTLTFNVAPRVKIPAGQSLDVATHIDGGATGPSTSLTIQTNSLSLYGEFWGNDLSLRDGPEQTIFFTN